MHRTMNLVEKLRATFLTEFILRWCRDDGDVPVMVWQKGTGCSGAERAHGSLKLP
jgi:hypothetical protein